MNILIFIVILLVLVVSHEFGHFIVAKKFGIRVDEFSFGFPPTLFKKKVGETTYKFNLLPFGGYVKIFGENPNDESISGSESGRSFSMKSRSVQSAVLLAGVVMNFLVAWLLLSVGFMTGLPSSSGQVPTGYTLQNESLVITSIVSDSPAEKAGLTIGDKITQLKSKSQITETPSPESVRYFIRQHGDESIEVSYTRGGEAKTATIIAESKDGSIPMIGISMDVIGSLKLPVHTAILGGFKLAWHYTTATVVGFYTLAHDAILGKADMSTITGPIGIVGTVGDAASFGFIYLLSFTALISINLAVINLIPFPALDGGRLLFLLIEKIKGSRIKPEIANMANFIGFGLLMILMLVITYHDVVKLF